MCSLLRYSHKFLPPHPPRAGSGRSVSVAVTVTVANIISRNRLDPNRTIPRTWLESSGTIIMISVFIWAWRAASGYHDSESSDFQADLTIHRIASVLVGCSSFERPVPSKQFKTMINNASTFQVRVQNVKQRVKRKAALKNSSFWGLLASTLER